MHVLEGSIVQPSDDDVSRDHGTMQVGYDGHYAGRLRLDGHEDGSSPTKPG